MSVRVMIGDVIADEFVLNRRLPRTVVALLFKPGMLTDEYLRGRMVRYIPPLRLYLVASIVFFLVLSFVGLEVLERGSIGGPEISANADSARALLLDRQRELLTAADTVRAGGGQNAVLQQMLAGVDSAIAAISDTATVLDSATVAALRSRVAGTVTVPPGERQPWARDITITAGAGWLERAMRRKLDQVAHLPPGDAFRALARDLLVYAPHMVFLLLPVFALLLKLLYIRRDRYYAEHFVFALHAHAFVFVMLTLIFVLPWGLLDTILRVWIAAYIWLAMKRVYDQGWLRTSAKWFALGFMYFFVFAFGMMGLAVATLLLT